MANVLPPEKQKEMRARFRARYLAAFSVVAIVGGIIFALALAPSAITLSIGGARLETPAPSATTSSAGAFLRDTKDLLAQLRPLVQATTTPTDLIAIIVEKRPPGLHIDRITYSTNPGKIVVMGTVASSSVIETYRNALVSDPHFTAAAIPVNSLIGSSNGSFTINLSGSF